MDHTLDTSTHEKLLKDIRETLQGLSDEGLHRLYPGISREEFLSQLQNDETSLLAQLRLPGPVQARQQSAGSTNRLAACPKRGRNI